MKKFMFPLSFKLGSAGSAGPHLTTRPHTYSRPLGHINSYFFFRDKICRGHEHSGVFPGKMCSDRCKKSWLWTEKNRRKSLLPYLGPRRLKIANTKIDQTIAKIRGPFNLVCNNSFREKAKNVWLTLTVDDLRMLLGKAWSVAVISRENTPLPCASNVISEFSLSKTLLTVNTP